MAVTPRRSTRGAIFTPSPHPAQATAQANTTYHWLSAPLPDTANQGESSSSGSSSSKTRYNSFRRIVGSSSSGQSLTPVRGKKKVGKGDQESRFAVGDGVMVGVDGGDGVGVLIGLWHDHTPHNRDRDGDGDGSDNEDEVEDEDEDEVGTEGSGKRMMAEVHWCFRGQDLPSIMKNVKVQDVSLPLQRPPIFPYNTGLEISRCIRGCTSSHHRYSWLPKQCADTCLPERSVLSGLTHPSGLHHTPSHTPTEDSPHLFSGILQRSIPSYQISSQRMDVYPTRCLLVR